MAEVRRKKMKQKRNWITLAWLFSQGAEAGVRVELDLTQNHTTIDAKAYGALKDKLGYYARDIETFSPETGDNRFTVATLNYNFNLGGSIIAGMQNQDPILGVQYSTRVGKTNFLALTNSTLNQEPTLSQLLNLERTGDKGLTTGIETTTIFNNGGYLLSKQRLRAGYTNKEGLGMGLAADLTQTLDTKTADLGIYLRATK